MYTGDCPPGLRVTRSYSCCGSAYVARRCIIHRLRRIGLTRVYSPCVIIAVDTLPSSAVSFSHRTRHSAEGIGQEWCAEYIGRRFSRLRSNATLSCGIRAQDPAFRFTSGPVLRCGFLQTSAVRSADDASVGLHQRRSSFNGCAPLRGLEPTTPPAMHSASTAEGIGTAQHRGPQSKTFQREPSV